MTKIAAIIAIMTSGENQATPLSGTRDPKPFSQNSVYGLYGRALMGFGVIGQRLKGFGVLLAMLLGGDKRPSLEIVMKIEGQKLRCL